MRRSLDRDRLHLLHMRDAAEKVQRLMHNRERDDLVHDRIFQLGLVKAVELIGEHANCVSDDLRAEQPDLPWSKIIRMRRIMVLNDWLVEPEERWETVEKHVPFLAIRLQRLIDTEDEQRKA